MEAMPSFFPDAYDAMLVRLKRARLEAGVSQIRAAEVLGREQPAISKIERGDRRIDPVELKVLADLYGKPLDWFHEKD